MSFRSVFRHPAFALMWTQRLLANVAVLTQDVTIGWQVYTVARQTHSIEESAFLVGMIGLAQFLPLFVFSLFAGAIADRHDRRKILMRSIGLQIICAAVLYITTQIPGLTLAPLFVISAILGATRSFIMPANSSLVPMLVPVDTRPHAVVWSSLGMQIGRTAGPWIGGILCAISPATAYAAAFFTYILAWSCMFFIRVNAQPQKTNAKHITMIREGLAYVWSNKVVFGAISLDLFAVLLGGATALLPVYAHDILKIGPQGFGLLRSAPALGAFVVLGIMTFRRVYRHTGLWMLCAVAIFGVATCIFAVSENLWLSLAMLVIWGAADSVSVFVRQTLVQIVTPDEFRGRVAAVSSMFIVASNELGEFESGVTARIMGPVAAVLFGGIGSIFITGLWAKLFPALRNADRFEEDQLQKT